jgi:ABC-type amino acid transport substrate-binding protein
MKQLWQALILLCFLSSAAQAQQVMRVGVKSVPPFAMQTDNGEWTGISVELWKNIALQQNWQTQWVVMESAQTQIQALANKKIDVAVGALSMTPEREQIIDFSYSFYSTGLGIATPVQNSGWTALLAQLISPAFLSAVGILAILLLGVGALLWLVEHKRNPEQFGGSISEGIGNGFWWSAVTMTTVGYGDKAPITKTGRLLATVWMFVSVITISSFTASIASSVTLNQMRTAVNGIEDLDRVRSLVVSGSTGEQTLSSRGIRASSIASPEAGLAALKNGQADALVYDEAVLRYLLRNDEANIDVLIVSGSEQKYALGLRSGFEMRENLNRSLLKVTGNNDWQTTLQQFIGHKK